MGVFYISLINLGKRPFGVSLLYMGWDQHYGYQLYQSDPSGNYTGWKATCIGNNHQVSSFFNTLLFYFAILGSSFFIKARVQGSKFGRREKAGNESLVKNFGC